MAAGRGRPTRSLEEDERSPARFFPRDAMLRGVMRLLHLSPRRVVAILILAMAGGLVAALLWERGELAGSDAFAYWTAVQRWLGGQDIYQVTPGLDLPPTQGALPFVYAPWSLYLFLPWALLPWALAWTVWRLAMITLFAVTVIWAYERRPLATALLFAVLSPALAANLDTGNINVFIVLGVWLGWFATQRIGGARLGGVAWAIGTAIKYVPAPLLLFVPHKGWRSGLVALAILAVLTLATWPQFARHLDTVFNYPRPVRLDYMLLAWAAVPWLWQFSSWPELKRGIASLFVRNK